MAPYAGAFFYVITVVIEKCRYSCGFMNPAVVLATHVVGGDVFSTDAAKHVLTYATGAGLGAVAAAAAKAVADGKVPGSKPAKHATSGKTKTKKKASRPRPRASPRGRGSQRRRERRVEKKKTVFVVSSLRRDDGAFLP
jgi:glycerol uptake facilitator-like aquaporin